MSTAPPETVHKSPRLISLDAFRGFIMICLCFSGFGLAETAYLQLEQQPDSPFWKLIAEQWEHCEWRGCVFWDLINPAFTFMVGMSMAYSYVRRQREGDTWLQMFRHALGRATILILLGIFLTTQSKKEVNITLVNVLTQIGLGYPFLFLCWNRPRIMQIAAVVFCLAISWASIVAYGGNGGVPGPGVTAEWAAEYQSQLPPAWHKNANIGHAIDVWLLNHLPQEKPFQYNSGGYQTISFVPSLATMIMGLILGEWVRSQRTHLVKFLGMLVTAILLLAAGYLLDGSGLCPNIKRIWTPSFGLLSTGWVMLMFSLFFGVIDLAGLKRWAFPFVVAGSNSIALYFMLMTMKPWLKHLYPHYLGDHVFGIGGPIWEPVVEACILGLTFWLICFWMWRQKILIRI